VLRLRQLVSFDRELELIGDLKEEKQRRMQENAACCPVRRTLTREAASSLALRGTVKDFVQIVQASLGLFFNRHKIGVTRPPGPALD
jgi:hypothetical protein